DLALHIPTPPRFPYTTLFRSKLPQEHVIVPVIVADGRHPRRVVVQRHDPKADAESVRRPFAQIGGEVRGIGRAAAVAKDENLRRSEEHTSELQSRFDLVCRLL